DARGGLRTLLALERGIPFLAAADRPSRPQRPEDDASSGISQWRARGFAPDQLQPDARQFRRLVSRQTTVTRVGADSPSPNGFCPFKRSLYSPARPAGDGQTPQRQPRSVCKPPLAPISFLPKLFAR